MGFEQQVELIKTLLDCHRVSPISEGNLPSVTLLLIQTVGGHTVTHVNSFPVLMEAITEFGFGGNKYFEEKYN